MPIAVRCPGCRPVEAPDRLAGKLRRCKSCREEFRVEVWLARSTGERVSNVVTLD